MSIGLKFLEGAVGVILTIVILSAGARLFNQATEASSIYTKKVEATATTLENFELKSVDCTLVSGSDVVNLTKKYQGKLQVNVYRAEGSLAFWTAGSLKENRYGDSTYINPSATFVCTLYRNDNDIVTRVYFLDVKGTYDSGHVQDTITCLSKHYPIGYSNRFGSGVSTVENPHVLQSGVLYKLAVIKDRNGRVCAYGVYENGYTLNPSSYGGGCYE